ncbi:single-stranded-DNA-specific exonuclease RecJ [Sphingopyxis terrae subsp. terrae NBRC 15098]|jgi:single-stranded-DNA-specific exonuclease|uniref:Single-stranded-DNA-specific exonuclease RecJ n=1 Tax=Sphingopyxis terrae subsp. terrae NBRC 15098 TaxID=1219058 RepID=A0A142VXA3_9SPHN|nr:single-stranded-DNA-specific exonuclease RecJ [Sphingopyxis terrae]AMU94443.1 single-stranded-DNA-specific exonuclease RecJ [Sphingopyxis terrae subsp. terrae NBRC 15098]
MTTAALGITRSILGQPWHWRRTSAEMGGESLAPDDLVTQLLLARGVARDDLDRQRVPTLRGFMPDPSLFRDMDAAAARLADAVEAREGVTIFGDYDVDGATSAALLVRLLRALDVPVGAYIPDRLMEGYGPSGAALVRIGAAGSRLVVTVDCGAQAFDAIAEAKAAGVEVIVVDHHQCATTLPQAFAVVNPNRLDEAPDAAAHGNLAAVGVAFLLGAALLRTLRARGFFGSRPEPQLIELLDLVALGTVADVARLTGFNRALVTQGLKVMARRGNIGMAALMDAARLTKPPTASDMGFALGPRINAGGRVGKSDLGVRLLTTGDPQEAADIAQELCRLNEERRAIEAAVLDAAIEASGATANAPVAIVAGDGWHPGVIGIVAGRLKEKLHRPAIVIAFDEDGVGKGSGRSISGVDLGAAILAAKETGLLVAGGGHAMAAGLTVERARVDALGAFLNERLAADVERASGDRSLLIDAVLAPRGINPLWCEAIESAGPYGAGWPAPRVATGPVRIVESGVVGTDHLRLIVAGDDGARFKAIAFRSAETELGQTLLHARGARKLWLAGRAKRDDWGSRPAAELHLEDAAWAE